MKKRKTHNNDKTIYDLNKISFEETKSLLGKLQDANYKHFVKAFFALETGINDQGVLNKAYEEFMELDDIYLLNPYLHDRLIDLGVAVVKEI